MGCGESKHAVATESTVTHRKESKADVTKKSKDTLTISVAAAAVTNKAAVEQFVAPESISEKVNEDAGGDDVAAAVADDPVKDVAANIEELNEGEIKETNKEETEEEKKEIEEIVEEEKKEEEEIVEKENVVEEAIEPDQRLINRESPNHYFSPRKYIQDPIDGTVSEERSEYFSPRNASRDDINAIVEKELVEETKIETKTEVEKTSRSGENQ